MSAEAGVVPSTRPGASEARKPPLGMRVRLVVSHVLLVLVGLAFASPLIYAIATSLKPADEVFTSPPSLVGSVVRWQNYVEAFNFLPFGRYLVNSFLVAVLGTLVVVVASTLSGYAFARLKFRGRDSLFLLFLGTLMIPQDVLVVPMYMLMQAFGWVDSYQALILPWAFTAFGTFLLRQFFLTVPGELSEAARVDGAGAIRTFWQIMAPLAAPTVSVLAVFTFVSSWNNLLWPLIVINDTDRLGTVPLGLAQFVGQQGTYWNLMMAASIIAMLPSVLLVWAFQRHLTRGMITSGLAGR